ITTAIINGRKPPKLTAQQLMRLMPRLPANWAEQRKLLGFRREQTPCRFLLPVAWLGERYKRAATQNHRVINFANLATVNRLKRGNAVTRSSDFGRPTDLSQGVEALHSKWGWIVALGIIYLLVGVLALYSVVTATVASVFVVGIMMLIAGVAEVVNAFQ